MVDKKIPNSLPRRQAGKFQIPNFREGFTLIELVIVAGIMIIIAIVSVNLLFSTLKGSIKAEVIKNAKQNGDYAISVMERMIRNASEVITCESGMSSIEITNPNNFKTTFSFSSENIASSGANLISSGYQVTSSSFDCNKIQDKPAVVTIKFTLETGGSSTKAEEKIKIPFQTTVSLRTY